MKAVIQAGGKGTRLRPFTVVLPKPLVPGGDVPIIEILLRWLCRGGVEEAFITLGYLGKIIRAACGDGSEYGLPITYVQEDTPLNTVGALRLVGRERLSETFFSLNGDILTDLNLRELAAFHKAHGGVLTVATTKKDIPTNLGVMDIERDRITAFREKPVLHQTVSMGVYCMEPEILEYIPEKVPFGFDDLMYALLDRNIPIYAYPHEGLWMDLGRPQDFAGAQEAIAKNQSLLRE